MRGMSFNGGRDMRNEVIDAEEFARRMKLKKTLVLAMLRRGELPGFKCGRLWRLEWPASKEALRSRPFTIDVKQSQDD